MIDIGVAIQQMFTHLNNIAVLQATRQTVQDDESWIFLNNLRSKLNYLLEAQEYFVKIGLEDVKNARKEAKATQSNKAASNKGRKRPKVRPDDDGSQETVSR